MSLTRTLLLIGVVVAGIYFLGVSGFLDQVVRLLRLLIDLVQALDQLGS